MDISWIRGGGGYQISCSLSSYKCYQTFLHRSCKYVVWS